MLYSQFLPQYNCRLKLNFSTHSYCLPPTFSLTSCSPFISFFSLFIICVKAWQHKSCSLPRCVTATVYNSTWQEFYKFISTPFTTLACSPQFISFSLLSFSLSQPQSSNSAKPRGSYHSKTFSFNQIPHLCPHKNSNSTPILKTPLFSSPAFPFLPHILLWKFNQIKTCPQR